jgi:protein-disulfide isomerase
MKRTFPALRATALLLCVIVAACAQTDAAADTAAEQVKVGAQTASSAPSTSAPSTIVPDSTAPVAAGDTLTDSALVERADRGRIKGPDQAMWVVMISDFQCPYCKQWHDSTMARLDKEYIAPGKIRFAFLHLPLTSIHVHARAEAEAALCASAQGKFWPYSEALFAAQATVRTMSDVTPLLNRIAGELALDTVEFKRCRGTKAIASLVNNDLAQAQQAKVQSTPSFIIGDFLIQGAVPYPDFKKAVDTALVVARSKRSR